MTTIQTDAEKVQERRVQVDQWALRHLDSLPYRFTRDVESDVNANFIQLWVTGFVRIAHSDDNSDVVNPLWLADDTIWAKIKHDMGYNPIQVIHNVAAPADYVRMMDSRFHTIDVSAGDGAWTMVEAVHSEMPNFNQGSLPIYIADVPLLLFGVGVHRSQRRQVT